MCPFSPFTAHLPGRDVTFNRPVIMGILNSTPDSFFDGGKYVTPDAVLQRARQLLADGADIIDLGVVSSRPGAELLAPEEEAARLAPLVSMLRAHLPEAIISVDTCFSLPAAKAVEAGADIINDISGGQFDDNMFPTVARLGVPYILMHTCGTPNEMQQHTQYADIVEDLKSYFSDKIAALQQLGVRDIWIDPGFCFAKTVEQNHQLLHRLDELVAAFPQFPLLTALSNKSMIIKIIGKEAADSELGTLALNSVALEKGSSLLRVHSPHPSRLAIELLNHTF
ncbi:MAG: dihydropteroate synthase [Bacteroidales bacterium]|nr:dihydropteroate synthase [Candidatus Colimorpha merdihippi]